MKEIKVTKENENQRIDKLVRKYLNLAPLSFIYKLFRKKDVKVNNHWVKENYIVSCGEEIKIYVTDSQLEEFNKPKDISKLKGNLDIVFEDDNVLILNKPKGILIHGDLDEKRLTLTNEVQAYLFSKGEFKNDGIGFIPSPVHRLDRNTSGICIFAKNLASSQELMNLFKERDSLDKYYFALVQNNLNKEEDTIDAPLLKNEETKMVKVASIKDGAKDAKTHYRIIDSSKDFALLDVHLLTGRTHQIRVHLAYINCPIIGDPKYGNFSMNRDFNKRFNYSNQFLHSYKITFKKIDGVLSYLSNRTFKADFSNKEKDIISSLYIKYKL